MRFRRRRNRQRRRAQQQITRQCAYFFIPLPQPLNVDDGEVCKFADPIDPDSLFDPESLSLGTFYDEFGHMRYCTVSLKIHQIVSVGPNVQFSAAMEAVSKALPSIGPIGNNDGGLSDARSTITVIEALVPIQDESEESLSPAFDWAIECIRKLQLGYARVSGDPVTLISRLQVPFAVPLAIREYSLGEQAPIWPHIEQFQVFWTNIHDSFLKGHSINGQPSPQDFSQVMHATRVAHEGPFARAHQLMEKATSFADHDNTVGSVLLGAATEMLVLDLAISLLWERGLDPQEASKQVLTRRFRTRSVEQLLRGPICKALDEAWSVAVDEGILTSLSEVMGLRNRALHQGDEPSDDEIRQTFQANREFHGQLQLALISQLELYPLTTSTLIAHEKIESLGKLLELEDTLEETPRPLDNWGAYTAYRFEVMRPNDGIGLDCDAELCGNLGTSHLALLLHPNGDERWWLVDEDASVATPARVPSLTRKQRTSVKEARRMKPIFGIEDSGGFAIRFEGVEAIPRSDPPHWYRMGDVWPICRWDRYPAWPLPHPLVLED